MNLHQAKGLEAPVVILADPAGGKPHTPDMHIVRSAEGEAIGYMRVIEAREGYRSPRTLAMPTGWERKEEAEVRFDAAEEVRLLYVAVTRAKEELLVVRWDEDKDASPWRALHAWLDERATPLSLEPEDPGMRARIEMSAEDAREAVASAAERLAAMREPTYAQSTVTDVVKGSGEDAGRVVGRGVEVEGTSDGFRGFSWGSAVHGALAAASLEPDPRALRASCRELLVQNERPLDDHGEPVELAELVELVSSVRRSDLWTRARRAERMLSEVPFSVPGMDVTPDEEASAAGSGRTRPQLDLFGESMPEDEGMAAEGVLEGPPLQVLEGVIDLAFLEQDGWVIADYKTDVGTDPDFARRRIEYRRQVDLYAEAWARLTGSPVKERVLFFTSQGREERW
jgi:ATP-dependent helicase/nuclease subunit A